MFRKLWVLLVVALFAATVPVADAAALSAGEPLGEAAPEDAGGKVAQPVPHEKTGLAPGDEVVEARTPKSKTFATADPGKYRTQWWADPVHFRGSQGKWADIDTSLKPRGQERFAAGANAFGLSVAKQQNSRVLASLTTEDGLSVGFGLADARPGAAAPDPKFPSVITYHGVRPAVDLRLTSSATGVKEELVLRSAHAPHRYVFPLTLNGLTARVDRVSGSVEWLDSDAKVRFSTPAGWMVDSSGDPGDAARSEGVSYDLIQHEGATALEVTLDRAWLDDPARVYPITVDPTYYVDHAPHFYEDTYYREFLATDYRADQALVTGRSSYNYKAYLQFGSGKVTPGDGNHPITAANFYIYNYIWRTCTQAVYVKQVTQAWTHDPKSFASPKFGPTYGSAGWAPANGCITSTKLDFNITSLAAGWEAETYNNYGMALVASHTNDQTYRAFRSKEYVDATKRPTMLIDWTNTPPTTPSLMIPANNAVLNTPPTELRAEIKDPDGDWGYDSFGLEKKVNGVWTARSTGTGDTNQGYSKWTTLGTLAPGEYRWQARTFDTIGEFSPWSGFSTFRVNAAPSVPVAVAPASNATVVGTPTLQARYQDDADPGSVTFWLYRLNADGTRTQIQSHIPTSNVNPGITQSWTPTNLTPGSYSWRTQAKDSRGLSSAASAYQNFTVNAPNAPPDVPVLNKPTAGATVTTLRPTFEASYNDKDDDDGRIQVRVLKAGVTVGTYSSTDGASPRNASVSWSQAPAPLDDGTTYTWEARAYDGFEWSAWSSQRTFTTDSNGRPDTPTIPDPANQARLRVSPRTLSVIYSDPDGDAGTVKFVLKAEGQTTPIRTATSNLVTSGSRATLPTPRLESLPKGTYTWTATAKDNRGAQSKESDPATFTFTVGNVFEYLGFDGHAGWAGDVNTAIGNFAKAQTDVKIATAGPELALSRTYNSRDTREDYGAGAFGPGWTFSYEMQWRSDANGNVVEVLHPDGRREPYRKQADGYKGPKGHYARLTTNPNGPGYLLTTKDDTVYTLGGGKLTDGILVGRLTSITDANGRKLTLAYNADGNQLQTVTDSSSQRRLTFTWTGNRVTKVATNQVAAHGGPLEWEYGYTNDKLTSVCQPRLIDGEHACTTYGHDATSGLLNRVTRPEGNDEVRVGYGTDASGDWKVAWRENGVGDGTAITYKSDGSVETVDPRGALLPVAEQGPFRSTQYHDPENRLERVVNPAGFETKYEYDDDGNRNKIIDANLNTATITHGPRGNPTVVTNPAGETTYNEYENDLLVKTRDGRSASATDPDFLTAYEYDTNRNKISEMSPATKDNGPVTKTWAYTDGTEDAVDGGKMPPGLLKTETDGRGAATTYRYDAAGDLREVADRAGLTTTYAYDELGRRTTETKTGDGIETPIVTSWDYDEVGNVIRQDDPAVPAQAWTADAATNPTAHQLRTVSAYDLNGNLIRKELVDLEDANASRVTIYAYDNADREFKVTDPEGGILLREFDPAGNVKKVTDQEGRVTETVYDGRNLAQTVTLLGFDDDPTNAAGENADRGIVLQTFTYDPTGRKKTETDAMGRKRRWTYDGADRVQSLTLIEFENSDGMKRDIELEGYEYDKAGNVKEERTGGGKRVVSFNYDNAGWKTTRILDPDVEGHSDELSRQTDFTRDANGNPTLETLTGGGRTETITRVFDSADRKTAQTVENGQHDLKTTWEYDARGLVLREVNPRGNAEGATATNFETTQSYDDLGRLTSTTAPPVPLGGTNPPSMIQPVTSRGYDAFGNLTHERDARGHVTTTQHDGLDRKIKVTHPAYMQQGLEAEVQPLVPTETFSYDKVGNLIARTSRRGSTTNYTFDALNRVVLEKQPAPDGTADGARPTIETDHNDVGSVTKTVDPIGAVITKTYDDLDRVRTVTHHIRSNGQEERAQEFEYDDLGNRTSESGLTIYGADGERAVTTHKYNANSELIETAEPSGEPTTTTYDVGGRPEVETDGLGRQTVHTYDLAGREIKTVRHGADGQGQNLAVTTYEYDPAGNRISSRSPRGNRPNPDLIEDDRQRYDTRYDYDALNRLEAVTVPVSDTTGHDVVTSYGYDAAGNNTHITDGNGNETVRSYQSWNLKETVVEPSTAAHPDEADRTWTLTYDAGGLPIDDNSPGGVGVTRIFDALGRLISEHGQGPDAPLAERGFGYDLAGRRTSVSHPDGQITFEYDDRGLLISSNGPAEPDGQPVTFGYDPDGRMTDRSDAAGSSTFTWTKRDELKTAQDGLTGATRTYAYDTAGQLKDIALTDSADTPGATRAYQYDGLGRLTLDTLKDPYATKRAELSYGYDRDGNLKNQTITYHDQIIDPDTGQIAPATVNLGEGTHTYCYDHAGRLTRWDRPLAVTLEGTLEDDSCGTPSGTDLLEATEYTWDNAGNRLTASSPLVPDVLETYTYDQRNRLTSGPAGQYQWSARGTLLETTDGASTATYSFDGLGRQTARNNVSYAFDGLDRIAHRSAAGETGLVTETFAYAGMELDPVDDNGDNPNTATPELGGMYARSPGGRLLAMQQGLAEPTLVGLNRHGDLATMHDVDGGLTDTRVWDPFGEPVGLPPLTESGVGYQADWTDPASGQVWMGARFYDPANANFTARDTYNGELTTPVSLNRYTYAANNPLLYFDPDGRRFIAGHTTKDESAEERAVSFAHLHDQDTVAAANRVRVAEGRPTVQQQKTEQMLLTTGVGPLTLQALEATAAMNAGDLEGASALQEMIDALTVASWRSKQRQEVSWGTRANMSFARAGISATDRTAITNFGRGLFDHAAVGTLEGLAFALPQIGAPARAVEELTGRTIGDLRFLPTDRSISATRGYNWGTRAGIAADVAFAAKGLANLAAKASTRLGSAASRFFGRSAPNTTRVGRWMGQDEFDLMSRSGRVVEGGGGRTYVVRPPNPDAYPAGKGVYAEFDVPSSSLHPASKPEWAVIPGPNAGTTRYGSLPAEMPPATCIELVCRR